MPLRSLLALTALAATARAEEAAITVLSQDDVGEAGWHQRFDCAQGPRPEIYDFTSKRGGRRKDWREPDVDLAPTMDKKCCFPDHGKCFRAVIDDAIMLAEDKVADCGERAANGECEYVEDESHARYMDQNCQNTCGMISDDDNFLQEQVQAIFEEQVGLNMREVIRKKVIKRSMYPPNPKTEAGLRSNWTNTHADWYEDTTRMFVAILFLGDAELPGKELEPHTGGGHGFADKFSRDSSGEVQLERGTIIKNRRNRLVLFSGGGENYNNELVMESGVSRKLEIQFTCRNCPPPVVPTPETEEILEMSDEDLDDENQQTEMEKMAMRELELKLAKEAKNTPLAKVYRTVREAGAWLGIMPPLPKRKVKKNDRMMGGVGF